MPRPWPLGPLLNAGIRLWGLVFGDEKGDLTGGSKLHQAHAVVYAAMLMSLVAWFEGYRLKLTSVSDEDFEIQLYNRSDDAACNTATEYTKIWEALTDQAYNGGYDLPILQDSGDATKKSYSVG